ncbi:uncharacterized protein TNCV_44241 [Trichonephila clavipes]|nr:uncharacterized protein TNCV_44241 [Trichonephila clavipes]
MFVWPRGECLHPAFAFQQHTNPTAGMMIYGDIAYDTNSPFILIHATLTVQRYVYDFIQSHLLLSTSRLSGATFQQSYARPRTTRMFYTISTSLPPFPGFLVLQICLQSISKLDNLQVWPN